MKSISTIATTLGVASAVLMTAPADAQRRNRKEAVAAVPAVDPNARVYNFSKAARPLIAALQTAVNARDAAAYTTSLTAAQAAATTTDDRYAVAQLQLKNAIDTNSLPAQATAIEALIASGGATPTELPALYDNMGRLAYAAKDDAKAAFAFERLLTLRPNDSDTLVTFGELRNRQGRTAEGIGLIERAIAAKTAAGQPVDENWYKRALSLSSNAKLTPQAVKLGREWVSAYPTASNWRDALETYRFLVPLDEAAELDRFRLMRASGALQGERSYKSFADVLMFRRLYGEAKSVLDEGVSKRIIDGNKPEYKALISQAATRSAADRPTIVQSEAKAQASASSNISINVADSYFGYGDYAKAATFYRAALGKTGVDANLANTRLGIALAMTGDKAGATAAFDAVTGPRQDLARYWSLWASKRA